MKLERLHSCPVRTGLAVELLDSLQARRLRLSPCQQHTCLVATVITKSTCHLPASWTACVCIGIYLAQWRPPHRSTTSKAQIPLLTVLAQAASKQGNTLTCSPLSLDATGSNPYSAHVAFCSRPTDRAYGARPRCTATTDSGVSGCQWVANFHPMFRGTILARQLIAAFQVLVGT